MRPFENYIHVWTKSGEGNMYVIGVKLSDAPRIVSAIHTISSPPREEGSAEEAFLNATKWRT